jgi:plastocyanin
VNGRLIGTGLALAAFLVLAAAGAASAPAAHTVTIEGMSYAPASLTVKRGERIVWVNKDPFPHTVTSAAFDSHSIAPNGSWSYVAKKPGRYDYRCTIHPTMQATLIVP